ncbi:uncharacterized protein [Drosophila bipectinata]|uniref:uncharacterized protein n=1 Tax=Drosophila bipectinata TaxID=42026 RepID=UPI001C894DF5|nr:uncharacterized protein LOC108127987 [Drosophila bipectinata]
MLVLIKNTTPLVEFTNVKCTSHDLEFNEFEYCFLKSLNRSYKYMSLKAKMYKIPVTKTKINFSMLKKFNGYKPFLYNITVDGCKVFRHPKSSPIFSFFFNTFKSFSNLNHTCPYDHDLIVDKLTTNQINHQYTAILPFSKGEYLIHTDWYAYDVIRSTVDLYFKLS